MSSYSCCPLYLLLFLSEKKQKDAATIRAKNKKMRILYIISFCFILTLGKAQNLPAELVQLINQTAQNNLGLQAAQLQVDKYQAQIKSAYTFDKTNVYYSYDQNNLALNNLPLKVFGAQQRFDFPTVYGAQKKMYTSEYEREKSFLALQKNKLNAQVSQLYNQVVYVQHQQKTYQYLDSLYENFSKASTRKFELGETNYLEKINAQAKFQRIRTLLTQLAKEKESLHAQLKALLPNFQAQNIQSQQLEPLPITLIKENKALYTEYFQSIGKVYQTQLQLQKQQWLPQINLEYFRGNNALLSQSLYGFQVGLAIPLLFSGNVAKTKVARLEYQSWEQQQKNQENQLENFVLQKRNELQKHQLALDYYQQTGKKLASEIIKVASKSFKNGEIDFFQYIQSLENATTIEMDYLQTVSLYNQTAYELYYLNY
jgi:heavy metal efflux system protein